MQSNKPLSSNETIPLFMSVKQASRVCGIGERKLRKLISQNEIEHISNGNRRLLTEEAIYDWYNRTKTPIKQSKAKD